MHEIALGAQHAFGSDKQWSRLVAAGVAMMAQMASGELTLLPLVVGDFDALPSLLTRVKQEGKGKSIW